MNSILSFPRSAWERTPGRSASLLLLLATILATGCASAPNEQLLSCQKDKEQLLATISQQREANRAMHEQVASLESRLDQAEKQLARGDSGTRLSSRPVEVAPLPWRSPGEK
jgi:septal ring factor EnvC (AmiA/AmiB activator)